jgi:serine/threonine protein kinase
MLRYSLLIGSNPTASVALVDSEGRAFVHSYEAPEGHLTGSSSPTSDLFSAALTLWAAFTGTHPYRLTGEDEDETIMAADERGQFPGPPDLASILEPILQGDPYRRPTTADAERSLLEYATRNGTVPAPFPPDF